MLSKKEVKHIAKLARLGLSEKEIAKFQKELSSILDYFEKLKEADVSNVLPTSHPLDIKNMVRRDEAQEKPKGQKEKLLELMPKTKEGYLKVKSVL